MEEILTNKAVFLKLSVHITGFSQVELLGTGMYESYYDEIHTENPENVTSFFETVRRILEKPNDEVDNEIKNELIPVHLYSGLARRIVLLWYTGIWSANGETKMVSSASYIQSLIWPAAQTHPAGAKQPGYASWSRRPLF